MTWLRTLREWGLGVILAVVALVRNIGDDTPGELTAEKDPQGKSVLRVLLAAVFGFDSVNDLWKVNIGRREPLVIQTHNAVSVPLSNFSNSAVQTATGYDSVATGSKSDVSHARSILITWCSDSAGVNEIGTEALVSTGTAATGAGRTTVKAPYFKVTAKNEDGAAAHVMSSWTTLIP